MIQLRGAVQSDAGRGLIIVALTQVPFLLLYARNLWQLRPHYEFFPLVLIAVGALAWRRWPRDTSQVDKGQVDKGQPSLDSDAHQRASMWMEAIRWLEWLLLGLGLASQFGAVALFSPWLSAVAGTLIVGGLLLRFAGPGALAPLLPVWLLLWLVVTPPLRLDQSLVQAMQRTTSLASSTVMDVLGAKHLMAGNVIELPGKRLFVAEACSGVHSQLVLIACAAIYVVAVRRTWLRGSLLVASAFLWAPLVNIARVTCVALLSIKTSWDLSTGWPHEALGYGFVAMGFLLLASTDQMLALLFARVPWSDERDAKLPIGLKRKQRNPLIACWNRCFADPLPPVTVPDTPVPASSFHFQANPLASRFVVACACLGLLQVATLLAATRDRTISLAHADVVYDEESLPAQLDQWQRVEFVVEQREKGSDEGSRSQIWRYRAAGQMIHISVDYPFQGWHELTGCYVSQGWTVVSRKKHATTSAEGASARGDFVVVELSKPTGEYGLLMFGLFDGAGRPIAPRASHWRGLTARLTASPLLDPLLGHQREIAAPDTTSIQVQQLVVGRYRLSDDERQIAQDQFQSLRNQLRMEWVNRNNGNASRTSLAGSDPHGAGSWILIGTTRCWHGDSGSGVARNGYSGFSYLPFTP